MAEGGKTVYPLSLKTLAVFALAKVTYGQVTLPDDMTDMRLMYPQLLEAHITNLMDNPLNLPTTLYKLLKETLQHLQRGLLQAHAWEIAHINILPFSILNAEMAGCYAATRYISPDGLFKEEDLIHDYVDDESQPLIARYRMACNFCRQGKIIILWKELQANHEVKQDLHRNFQSESELVQMWTAMFSCAY